MIVDEQKLSSMLNSPLKEDDPLALSRDGNVFNVGCRLPVRETMETIFDSYCQAPAGLFKLYFDHNDHYRQGEMLARQIKKNFSAHLLGSFDYPVQPDELESAYAAGLDILDIPLSGNGQVDATGHDKGIEERLESLRAARAIFPKWSVSATLMLTLDSRIETTGLIGSLLNDGIVPLVGIPQGFQLQKRNELSDIYIHLSEAWKRHRVNIKPLQPLIDIVTPLVHAREKRFLKGFIDKLHGRQMLAASDLRRSLRVRQVEESFESAGL